MASNFKVGDLVWAKMKGFPAWPGKVIEPKPEVKRPANKKNHHFIFFFGSENYAWIPQEAMWAYMNNKQKFTLASRIPRGFKEAVEAIEDAVKELPDKGSELPSIDEELAQIFPNRSFSGPHKDYTREPLSGKKSHLVKKPEPDVKVEKNNRNSTPKFLSKSLYSDSRKAQERKSTKQVKTNSNSRPTKSKVVAAKAKSIKQSKDVNTSIRKSQKRSASPVPTANQKSYKRQKIVVKVAASPIKKDPAQRQPASPQKIIDIISSVQPPVSKSPKPAEMTKMKPHIPDESESGLPESPTATTVTSVSSATQIDESVFVRALSPTASIEPTLLKIGFLGLGIIGQGIVMNLIRSGHEVTVWNRTSSKCRDFVKEGAFKGNTPADVVQSCDITFSCISDSTAVKDVVFGNCGVIQGIQAGKGYIEMSTIDEETIKDVCEAITIRGGRFLEAPVCGSRVPALEGQLVILASGDRKLYEECHSCFEAIGRKSFFLGEIGMATRMKLVVNMMLGSMMASLAETMSLAEKSGLDQDDVATILSLGPLASTTLAYKSQAILNGKYDPHFPLQHQQKDLRLALELGDKVEQPLYVAAAANELYKKARQLGYGESDISSVYRAASA